MESFTYYIPTIVYFGRNQIQQLGAAIRLKATKVLLVYGGGSAKLNGSYQDTTAQLNKYGIDFIELSGVEPNPKIETVRKGIQLCRNNQLDGVLAIGGGSVIDCAKTIAAGVMYPGDAWDIPSGKYSPEVALPIFTVLTAAATGSEMDPYAVISNPATNEKLDYSASCCLPTCSIMDPTYTFSTPSKQTSAGTADIFSHILENYFLPKNDGYMQDRLAEALMKTCIHYGPLALLEPDNYEARANLMWTSSWAINGLLRMGKVGSWSVHKIEHELSAFYDIAHGVGLAILTPVWMSYVLNAKTAPKFAEYGISVWELDRTRPVMDLARAAIECTRTFFISLGLPKRLSELGIDDKHFEEMAKKARTPSFDHTFVPLSQKDILQILKQSL